MAIRDFFKVSRRTFVNPTAWVDFNALKYQNQTIWTILRSLFSTPRPTRQESFHQAMQRLHMSEEDVRFGATNYRIFAMIFFIVALIVLFYSFFLLFQHGSFFGWFLGLSVSALFCSQAFKYDFWALQMRRRQLGLSFDDWKQSILGDKDKAA